MYSFCTLPKYMYALYWYLTITNISELWNLKYMYYVCMKHYMGTRVTHSNLIHEMQLFWNFPVDRWLIFIYEFCYLAASFVSWSQWEICVLVSKYPGAMLLRNKGCSQYVCPNFLRVSEIAGYQYDLKAAWGNL